MKNEIHRHFPLFLDISAYDILIVGGGTIATRRVRILLEFACNITVVSPEVTPTLKELEKSGRICWWEEVFYGKLLTGRDMVIAATNIPQINEDIGRKCREQGILVNVVSNVALCDFHFPGVILQDEVTIGINASGVNHRKTVEVRKKIENMLQGDRTDAG